MIEALLTTSIAISLGQMGILLYIATKIAIINEMTHLIHDLLISIKGN